MAVSKLLLGVNLNEDKYAPTGLQESMLHDLDMGYYTLETRTPFSSIEWFEEENTFIHQYSLEEIGRVYAFNKLQDYIPLDLYLNLPTVVCDDIVTGLLKGKAERDEYDEKQRSEREGNPKSKQEEELDALAERLANIPKQQDVMSLTGEGVPLLILKEAL